MQSVEQQLETLKIHVEFNQRDCHLFAESLMKENSKLTYQDAVNVWMFTTIARLQIEVKSLDRRINS